MLSFYFQAEKGIVTSNPKLSVNWSRNGQQLSTWKAILAVIVYGRHLDIFKGQYMGLALRFCVRGTTIQALASLCIIWELKTKRCMAFWWMRLDDGRCRFYLMILFMHLPPSSYISPIQAHFLLFEMRNFFRKNLWHFGWENHFRIFNLIFGRMDRVYSLIPFCLKRYSKTAS